MARSQTMTIASVPPDASSDPSGEYARSLTSPVCPGVTRIVRPMRRGRLPARGEVGLAPQIPTAPRSWSECRGRSSPGGELRRLRPGLETGRKPHRGSGREPLDRRSAPTPEAAPEATGGARGFHPGAGFEQRDRTLDRRDVVGAKGGSPERCFIRLGEAAINPVPGRDGLRRLQTSEVVNDLLDAR